MEGRIINSGHSAMLWNTAMSNDQIKLLSLAIVASGGLVCFGLGQGDAQPVGGLVALVSLVFFIIMFNVLKR